MIPFIGTHQGLLRLSSAVVHVLLFFWSFTPPPPFPHPKKREAHIGRNMISFRAPEPEEVAEDLSVAISSCQQYDTSKGKQNKKETPIAENLRSRLR